MRIPTFCLLLQNNNSKEQKEACQFFLKSIWKTARTDSINPGRVVIFLTSQVLQAEM